MIVVSTTSLMLPPWTSRTLRCAARSVRTVTSRRCCDSGPMIGDSALGVRLASASTTRPAERAPAEAARSIEPVAVRTVSTTVSGSVTESRTAPAISENGEGREPRRPGRRAELLRVRRLVEEHLAEVDGLDAVDQHLVRLRQQRDLAVGEPLDDVDLPQRPAAVQRPRDDPADQLAELVDGSGPGQARSGGRGSRCRSSRRRPRPGWRSAPARPGSAAGSGARTRCVPGRAGPAGRSRTRTCRRRRSRRSRCAGAPTGSPRPGGPRPAAEAAHSSHALSSAPAGQRASGSYYMRFWQT